MNGFTFPNVAGVNLTACNTQSIGGATCTPGTPGCGWQAGNLTTFSQYGWGSGTGATLLVSNYGTVYFNTGFIFQIGWTGGFTAQWTAASILVDYLPATGTSGALDANLIDATSTSAGPYGGDVAALKLNIDFSDANLLSGNAGVAFGDLRLCGLTTTPGLNGSTVRQFLDTANVALGGGSVPYSIAELDAVALQLDGSFFNSSPSTFAQTNLVNGICP